MTDLEKAIEIAKGIICDINYGYSHPNERAILAKALLDLNKEIESARVVCGDNIGCCWFEGRGSPQETHKARLLRIEEIK